MRVVLVTFLAVAAAGGFASTSQAVAVLEVAPAAIEFGTVNPGTQTPPTAIDVTNTGTTAANDVTFALVGADVDQFVAPDTTGACTTMPPGLECKILGFRFAPTSSGPKSASYEVRVGGTVVATVALSGTGGAPLLEAAPAAIGFGAVTAGEQSTDVDLRVTNVGTGTAHDVTFHVVGPDASQFRAPAAGPCSTLPVGNACQLLLRFVPTRLGTQTATFVVRLDGVTVLTVPLSGTGLPTGQPRAHVLPAALTFRPARVGFVTTGQLEIVNTGGVYSLLTIGGVKITGADRDRFTIGLDACSGAQLTFGTSCRIHLRFTPIARGSVSATLVLGSDDPAAPLTVALNGLGIPRPPISPGPTPVPPTPPSQPPPTVQPLVALKLAWLKGQVSTRKRTYTLPLRSTLAAEATITITVDGRTTRPRTMSLIPGTNPIVVSGLRRGRNAVTVTATANAGGVAQHAEATKVVTVSVGQRSSASVASRA